MKSHNALVMIKEADKINHSQTGNSYQGILSELD
jgi:ATP-dependent Lon protease